MARRGQDWRNMALVGGGLVGAYYAGRAGYLGEAVRRLLGGDVPEQPTPAPGQPPPPPPPPRIPASEWRGYLSFVVLRNNLPYVWARFEYRGPAKAINLSTEVTPTGMRSQGYYHRLDGFALRESADWVEYQVTIPVYLNGVRGKVPAGLCVVWWALHHSDGSVIYAERTRNDLSVLWYADGSVRGFPTADRPV